MTAGTLLHGIPEAKPFSDFPLEVRGSDIDLLHNISTALIVEHDRGALYGKIVDAAVAIMDSQFGTMQIVLPPGDASGHGGELKLLHSYALPTEVAGFWQWVSPTSHSSCALALKRGQRAIISDFEKWDEIAGTDGLMAFRRAGIRSAQTTPLVSRGGNLLGMLSTHWSKPHQPSERDLRLLDILARQAADLLDRTIAEEALQMREATLRGSEERYRLLASIVESSEDAIITIGLDSIITSWNRGVEKIYGYSAKEIIGKPVTVLMPGDRQDEELGLIERMCRGERIEHYETIRRRKGGSLIDISLTVSPIKNAEGKIVGASKVARDITERKRTEDLVATLAREAEHRTKNVFSTVQATVSLSNGDTPTKLKETIQGRVRALADVHSLFVESRWAGADIATIVKQELNAYREDNEHRVTLTGPNLHVNTGSAQTLAVAIHELATNAAKYGALSIPQGKLHVEWSEPTAGQVCIEWAETNGPEVEAPSKAGFGTSVMQRLIAAQQGAIDFDWKRDGLLCRVTMGK